MSVYQRGGKWWVQYYEKVNGVLKAHRIGGWNTKREAAAEDAKIKALKAEGRSVLERRKSFAYTFDELAAEYRAQYKDQKYFRDKDHHLKVFLVFFSGKKLGEIGVKELEQFRNERKKPRFEAGPTW